MTDDTRELSYDAAPDPTPSAPRGISRRTVLAASAWAVPAVVAVTATPAFAVSGPSVAIASPQSRVLASGASPVTATVTSPAGTPSAGEAVSFTGPSGSTFTPSSATTDSAGVATTSLDLGTPWAVPGSTVTLSAISGVQNSTKPFTVVGANAYLQGVNYRTGSSLGTDSTSPALSTPTQLSQVFVSPITQIAVISSGNDSTALALLADGTVWSVGPKAPGRTGSTAKWAQMTELSDIVDIGGGSHHGAALRSDGTVWTWGAGFQGQLGTGGPTSSGLPAMVPNLTGVQQLSVSAMNVYARVGGTILAWGDNSHGQIGDGTTSNRNTPTTVPGISTATRAGSARQVAYAVLADGTVKAWGANWRGQLGNGTESSTDQPNPSTVAGLGGVTDIIGGDMSVFALMADLTVKKWGADWSPGELAGNEGTPYNTTTPTTLAGVADVRQWSTDNKYFFFMTGAGTVRYQISRQAPADLPGVSNVTRLARNGAGLRTAYFIR